MAETLISSAVQLEPGIMTGDAPDYAAQAERRHGRKAQNMGRGRLLPRADDFRQLRALAAAHAQRRAYVAAAAPRQYAAASRSHTGRYARTAS